MRRLLFPVTEHLLSARFTSRETEAQAGKTTYSRPHS